MAAMSTTPIREIYPGHTYGEWKNIDAFAALRSDGSVVTWGSSDSGGDSSAVANELASGVTQIFSSEYAFAALKEDGSVVTWGNSEYGGDSSAVANELASGVAQIFSSEYAFAALKEDGSVITWGSDCLGGDSSAVATELASGVVQIFSSMYAFAALKDDGSVLFWGEYTDSYNMALSHEQGNVTQIVSTQTSFAALKEDGTVVCLGCLCYETLNNVTQLFATSGAFAALKDDGSVVTWGVNDWGGDSSAVADELTSGVTSLSSSWSAFAALKDDGSVVTWGESDSGADSNVVADELTSGVVQIFSTQTAFAALKEDGSVVTWGRYGGDSSGVAEELVSGVVDIYSTAQAFAALKADGSVVTWGSPCAGFNMSAGAVADELTRGVVEIFTSEFGFAALKSDGTVVTWGGYAADEIHDIVGMANIYTDDWYHMDDTDDSGDLGDVYFDDLFVEHMESDSGTTLFSFSVSRDGDISSAASVDWTVTHRETDDTDFVDGLLPSGTVTFAAGETEQTITIEVVGDSTMENDEAFLVTLYNADGVEVGANYVANGVILNDDTTPVVTTVSDRLIVNSARTWYFVDGSDVDVIGNSLDQPVQIALGASATLNLAGGDDRVELAGNIADYAISTVGSSIVLTYGDAEVRLALNATDDDLLVFADGAVVAHIDPSAGGITLGGVLVAQDAADNTSLTSSLLDGSDHSFWHAVEDTNPSHRDSLIMNSDRTCMLVFGADVDVIGDAQNQTIQLVQTASATLNLAGGDDRVELAGSIADYDISTVGSSIVLTLNDYGGEDESPEVRFALNATDDDLLVFADGAAIVHIDPAAGGITLAGVLVGQSATSNTGLTNSLLDPSDTSFFVWPTASANQACQVELAGASSVCDLAILEVV